MNYFSFTRLIGAAWYQKSKHKRGTPAKQPRLSMELLEARTMPSTTTLPAPLVSDPTSVGGGFDPQIVIDPLNPLKMVEVHSTGAGLAGNYTTDGGQTWKGFGFAPNLVDPNLYQGAGVQRFTVNQSPSITFDLNEQLYVVSVQHDATNTSGAIFTQNLDFSGNSVVLQGVTTLLDSDPDPAINGISATGTSMQ